MLEEVVFISFLSIYTEYSMFWYNVVASRQMDVRNLLKFF